MANRALRCLRRYAAFGTRVKQIFAVKGKLALTKAKIGMAKANQWKIMLGSNPSQGD